MSELLRSFALALTLCSNLDSAAAAASADDPLLVIRAIDGSGAPITDAQAYLIETASGTPLSRRWVGVREGSLAILPDDIVAGATLSGRVRMEIRSPRHAWKTVTIDCPPPTAEVSVTLDEGREIELLIQGARPPEDLLPIVFASGQSVAAWLSGVQWRGQGTPPEQAFSAALVHKQGDRFLLRVPDDAPPIYVLIHHPGYVSAFQAGPFDTADRPGPIRLSIPERASLTVSVAPAQDGPHAYSECGMELSVIPEIPDGRWAFPMASMHRDEQRLLAEFGDLAPGIYSAVGFTGSKETRDVTDRPDYFSYQAGDILEPGERASIEISVRTFDEELTREELRGQHSVTLSIQSADGNPAAGRDYELEYGLPVFQRRIALSGGEVPRDGLVVVPELNPEAQATLWLSVNGERVAPIGFDGEGPLHEQVVRLAPMVGDKAPDLALTEVRSGEAFRLSDLLGQVVLLEFWASWCGPCQAPMGEYDALSARRDDWDGRAVILGASIDDSLDVIRDHVVARNLLNVRHAFCSEGSPGWACDAVAAYAVNSVPTAVLIDAEGRIAFLGNPSQIDVESAIDDLLARDESKDG
jgi:peroxiredoxin